jgi:radical SAM superfamily enzyme with C-terminal helix-hairpin-helix motif
VTLIAAIGGTAIFIAAAAMTVAGLTLPGRYSGTTPPPNVEQLGMGQVFGGIALLVLGLLIVGSTAALFADLPRSRALTTSVSALTALLAAVGVVLLMGASRRDLELLAAVGVACVAFAGTAIVLARRRP